MITYYDYSFGKTFDIKVLGYLTDQYTSDMIDTISNEIRFSFINIEFEVLSHNNMLRVEMIFERESDVLHHFDSYQDMLLDESKRKQFTPVLNDFCKNNRTYSANDRVVEEYVLKGNFFIVFSCFETIEKRRLKGKLWRMHKEKYLEKYSNFGLWKFDDTRGLTFFFYTEDLKEVFRDSQGYLDLFAELYNDMKEIDLFNYFTKKNFFFNLDSKENLDRNYAGSLFYYSR